MTVFNLSVKLGTFVFRFNLLLNPLPNIGAVDPDKRRQRMLSFLKTLMTDESGATAIEYGLIAALVSVAAVVALENMGTSLENMFTTVSGKLDTAVGTP
jgi:pilus assembly protein Flp/PilA